MLLLALSTSAHACGPYFDHPRLSWVGRSMLDAPTSRLDADLRYLAHHIEPPPGVHARLKTTAQGEAEDLRAALPQAEEATITAWLTHARTDLDLTAYPADFRGYILGARALHAEDYATAATHWEAVLDLPADQRAWRATWAAFMLPATRSNDPESMLADYQRVIDLAADGATDTLGLAAASLRHRADLLAGEARWAEAISECVKYRAAGGQKFCTDLKFWAASGLAEDDLTPLLSDPLAAELIGLYLTTGSASGAERWLAAAEDAAATVPGADRLAWASYQQGDFEAAARWVDRAGAEDPMAWWMTAKLALRSGNLDEAITALQQTVSLLPAPGDELFADFPRQITCDHSASTPSRGARIELGITLVAADRYEEALTAFLSAGDWLDGAWVAERLLTTDALQGYVDHWFPNERQNWWPPHSAVDNLLDGESLPLTQVPASMRHLLARRLAREGRWSDAVAYYPDDSDRYQARQIIGNLAIGRDTARSDTERGEALWAAAFAWKMRGWGLVSTEMEPDFRVLEGWYEMPSTTESHLNPTTESHTETELRAHRALAPSPAQLARLSDSGPTQRYHFVWTAQEVAWEAVQLLPGDHPDFLEAGCIAGTWTRWRDPEAADRFWKLMYDKARQTPSGKALFAEWSWFRLLNEDGRCDLPQPAAPAPSAGCSAAPTGAFSLLMLLAVRRRRVRSQSSAQ
ncbi:MAG: tetratricopeptide (TPR) repeat protein [Myxococcota bacterium]|jgi:tetratricopeptide (TPR) repeat protein